MLFAGCVEQPLLDEPAQAEEEPTASGPSNGGAGGGDSSSSAGSPVDSPAGSASSGAAQGGVEPSDGGVTGEVVVAELPVTVTSGSERWGLPAPGQSTIGAGVMFACALTRQGRVACWGYNAERRCGVSASDDLDVTEPRLVPGVEDGVSIAVGPSHACVLRRVGSVVCWGDNSYGALGRGNRSALGETAGAVLGLPEPAVAVSSGWSRTCVLTATARVYCWGVNVGTEKLETDAYVSSAVPLDMGTDVRPRLLEAGFYHLCYVSPEGQLLCWGDGMMRGTPSPVEIPDADRIALLAAGDNTCFTTSSGAMRCWGNAE